MKKVEGIENVKYLVINESMYFVIRASIDNQLYLELYDCSISAFNVNNPTRQFDLSWQISDGFADLSRENENYFVKNLKLNSKNMLLLNALLVDDSKSIEHLDHILLLSIDQKLYWINYVSNEIDYTIETILILKSRIMAIELIRDLFFVLENSGLTIYFTSTEPSVLSKKEIYLGQIVSFEFVHKKCCFVYSNGLKIVILYFMIPSYENNHYEIVEIELSGIVAITYIKEINLILGISENNLLYQIPLKNKKVTYKRDEFIEIETQHVHEIQNMNRILDMKTRCFLKLEKMYQEEQKQLMFIKTCTWNNLESEEHKILCKRIYNSDDQTIHFEVNLKFCNTEALENFKMCLSCESEEHTNVICIQTKTRDEMIKFVLSKNNKSINISSMCLHCVINLHENSRILKYFVQFEETTDDPLRSENKRNEHSKTLIQKIENIINKQETRF